MEIKLYKNSSDERALNKNLSSEKVYICTLGKECSVQSPIIQIISSDTLQDYNYAYIPLFNRYYFIGNISIVRNNLFSLSLSVDVLMSFKEDIKNATARITRQEYIGSDFLVDDMLPVYNYKENEVIAFPYEIGDKNNLQYILTVGGSN